MAGDEDIVEEEEAGAVVEGEGLVSDIGKETAGVAAVGIKGGLRCWIEEVDEDDWMVIRYSGN